MPGCTFKSEWLKDPQYNGWICKDSQNVHYAYCKYCSKRIDISTMGTSALRSHARGKKHQDIMKSLSGNLQLETVARAKNSKESELQPTARIPSMSDVTSREDVLKAEIWWGPFTVSAGLSFHASENATFVWQQQFSDSCIAQKSACGETKTMYLIRYGIAEHFKKILAKKLVSEPFVLLFDESHNKEQQLKQLDLLVRFWDHDTVVSRYLKSALMGHGRAIDLHKEIYDALSDNNLHLELSNIIQLSMDGPNVNLALHKKLSKTIQDETPESVKLIDIVSCGLHTLHNGFRDGYEATKWELKEILKALYKLFDAVPARRDDFENVSGGQLYALKFCSHRWLENRSVAERAITILPSIRQYVKDVESGKLPSPGTQSFNQVVKSIKDPLLEVKLYCFVTVAKSVEPFLQMYQTDRVMIPFLTNDLAEMVRNLLRRFIKSDDMKSAQTTLDLIRFDIDDVSKHRTTSIDLGFKASELLKALVQKKKVSELQCLQLRNSFKLFLITIVKKIVEKSPIKYKFARAMRCLDPQVLVNDPDQAVKFFRIILSSLVEVKRLDGDEVDSVLDEFRLFADSCSSSRKLKEFDRKSENACLDKVLFDNFMSSENRSSKLWHIIRQILLLSHGQAAVERGFSTNKHISTENQSLDTLIDLRTVKDHINSVGGLKKCEVTKELIVSCSSARQRYHMDLEKKKADRIKEIGKRKATETLESTKKKIQNTLADIDVMTEQMIKNYDKAEQTKKVSFVTVANALRKEVDKKKEGLVELQSLLESQRSEFAFSV